MATVRRVRGAGLNTVKCARTTSQAAHGEPTMKTVVIRIGDVADAQKHGGHITQITQMSSGVISPGPRAKGELSERCRHEEWKQQIEEDWQSHFERLQQCVCELLLKNQQLRMALMAADERERGYRDAVNL